MKSPVETSASRRHPRARVDLPVELGDRRTTAWAGRCVELSVGGMRVDRCPGVRTSVPGTPVHVRLSVTDHNLALDAKVVWSGADESGLEFDSPVDSIEPVITQLRAERSWRRF